MLHLVGFLSSQIIYCFIYYLKYYIIFIILYSSESPSSLITESLSITQSLSSLSSPSSSDRMSSSDPSKALHIQHFLKDLTIMLSGMAFHAADTHRATYGIAALWIFPVSVNSRAGSAIQVRYCCLNLFLKGLLMDTPLMSFHPR